MVAACLYFPCLAVFLSSANGLTCLQCTHVPAPRLCTSVTECFPGEICGVEKLVSEFGGELFNVGCMKEEKCRALPELHHCVHCCNSSLCNSEGCGKQGYLHNRGPVCFNCPVHTEISPCHTIDVCSSGEKCFLEGKHAFGEVVYSSKCLDNHECIEGSFGANILVGRDLDETNVYTKPEERSVFEQLCRGCCENDLCNVGCNATIAATTLPSLCSPNPCQHGQCFDVKNGFVCVCDNGYEGRLCNASTSLPSFCTQNLCQHGQCFDVKDDFVCLCDHGYEGRLCNDSIFACNSNPCKHGRCVNMDDSYQCICDKNFGGKNCNISLAEGSDCYDTLHFNIGKQSGVYNVTLWKSNKRIQVYCDMDTDGGGWTVFQSRFNGSVDFYRTFFEYEHGFGSLFGEFWLGLSYVQEMVAQNKTELRLDLTDANDSTAFEVFQNFRLGLQPNYTLYIDKGTGTAGDTEGMSYNNGSSFMANDYPASHSCVTNDRGGWWYTSCAYANLNGDYVTPGTNQRGEAGVTYRDFQSLNSLKATQMKFRRI